MRDQTEVKRGDDRLIIATVKVSLLCSRWETMSQLQSHFHPETTDRTKTVRKVSRNNNNSECQQTLLCKLRRMRQNCLFRHSGHCSEIEKFGCVLHNFSSRPGKRPEASRGMLDPKRPPSFSGVRVTSTRRAYPLSENMFAVGY